jgi:uncharacterized metal-binding protein YceD (DUF177 family)
MDVLAPFRIPIATLKADAASYAWELGPDFLAIFDDEHELIKGTFSVEMHLERTAGIVNLDFIVEGMLDTTCDRCMASIMMPVEADYQMIVKFGDPNESNDEVIFVDQESPELNVGQHLYDFILLSVPISQRIENCETMDDSPCDITVLTYLSENQIIDKPKRDDDPLWDDLKKVIDN